jgi:hypothetical protein
MMTRSWNEKADEKRESLVVVRGSKRKFGDDE